MLWTEFTIIIAKLVYFQTVYAALYRDNEKVHLCGTKQFNYGLRYRLKKLKNHLGLFSIVTISYTSHIEIFRIL